MYQTLINFILSFIIVLIVGWLILRYVILELMIPVIVMGLAEFVVGNIKSTLQSAEYEYAPYLYNKYRIFRMKKSLGKLYVNEPFIWTDEQDDEQFRLAYKYATTIHDV